MTSRKNTAGAAVQAQPLPKRSQAARPSDWPSAWQAMHVCLVVIEGRLVTLAEVCGKKPDRKARQFDVECAVELALAHIRRRSEEHTSELQSPCNLVCRLLLEKKTEAWLLDAFSADKRGWTGE